MRPASSWTTRERGVVGVVVILAAAVGASQVSGERSVGSALTYAAFMLGMVGLTLGTVALYRSAGRRQDAGTSAAQKVMLAVSGIVVVLAAASSARMDDGFVLAAFVVQVALGLVYVVVAGFATMAFTRARSR